MCVIVAPFDVRNTSQVTSFDVHSAASAAGPVASVCRPCTARRQAPPRGTGRTLEGSVGPRSQNGKVKYTINLNSMLSLDSTFVLHAENRGVLIWSSRPIHASEWILKFSPTLSRVTVIQTMATIRRKLWQQLVIFHTRFDALKPESRNFCYFWRGHSAA